MQWHRILSFVLLAGLAFCGVAVSVCFWRFRDRRKELALGVTSALVTLVVAELLLRVFAPQIMEHDNLFVYDATLGWKFAANREGLILYPGEARHRIRINSLGFRGPIPPMDANVRRILVLGDSFVTNISVADDEVFTEVMGRELGGTAVLNFGVNGYGPVQEYLLLREWFPKVRPDVVVMVIYIRNDFEDNVRGDWLYPRPVATWNGPESGLQIHPPPPPQSRADPYWEAYRRLHLFHLLDRGVANVADHLSRWTGLYQPSRVTPPELYLCRLATSPDTEVMYRTMEEVLRMMARYVRDRGVPLVLVVAPSMVQVQDELWSYMLREYAERPEAYRRSLPNERLRRFADHNDLPLLDLLPILAPAARSGKVLYNQSEEHWTSEGNRLVANALVEYLRSRSLVD